MTRPRAVRSRLCNHQDCLVDVLEEKRDRFCLPTPGMFSAHLLGKNAEEDGPLAAQNVGCHECTVFGEGVWRKTWITVPL